jgi:hypothetical protein
MHFLRFTEAAVRFTPMVALLGCLMGLRSSRGAGRAAIGVSLVEVAEANYFAAKCDLCHASADIW